MNEEQEAMYLKEIHEVAGQGPFRPDWKSLSRFRAPEWFTEAKFGIFIHWGLYSVAAHKNEWYSRNMYIQEKEEWSYHRNHFGPHTEFGYKDFIPMFTAKSFEPQEWAEIFREAGARYVFPVAEHHDGFQMYRSRISAFNAYDMGPKRDILGELKQAVEEAGMTFCTSSHRAEHWFFMGHGKEFDSDVKDPLKRSDFYWPAMPEPDPQALQSEPYPSEEFLQDWLLRTCEIIDSYRPSLLYFDWWLQHEAFKEPLKLLAAYYYNRGVQWGKPVGICYKHDAMMFGSGIVEVERGTLAGARPFAWQTDTAIAKNSWCYTDALEYKTSRQIITTLVDIVSKGGNLLLNIGPKGDGSLPEADKEILKEIGVWLKVNGEAIYGSRPWRVYKEGPAKEAQGQFTENEETVYTAKDIRFTAAGDSIYATILCWPKDGSVTITALKETQDMNVSEFHGLIADVSVLGQEKPPRWHRDKLGLYVKGRPVETGLPVVIRVRMR